LRPLFWRNDMNEHSSVTRAECREIGAALA